MLKRVRTYRFLTQSLASIVFLASILPFIEHACLMAADSDMSVIRKCCCKKATQHGHDASNHGDHAMMGEEENQDYMIAKSSHAHHQAPDHQVQHKSAHHTPAEPVEDNDTSCDHEKDQTTELSDACCSVNMQGFTDHTTARIKSTSESLTDLSAIFFITSRLIEVQPPVIHPPPAGDAPPPGSTSRQVLFSTFLI